MESICGTSQKAQNCLKGTQDFRHIRSISMFKSIYYLIREVKFVAKPFGIGAATMAEPQFNLRGYCQLYFLFNTQDISVLLLPDVGSMVVDVANLLHGLSCQSFLVLCHQHL